MNARSSLAVVGADLPHPPYPADAKSRGWRFEIDAERLLASDTWAYAAPEAQAWLLKLWVLSWTQIPAGSLPAEESAIAARIGMPLGLFNTHRDVLMRGWQKCSDGRLYHPVIGEQVIALYEKRRIDKDRKAAWRAEQDQRDKAQSVPRDSIGLHGIPTESNRVQTPEPEPEPEKLNSNPLSSSPPANVDGVPSGAPNPRHRHRADAITLLLFLNEKAGRHFRPTDATLKPIIARLKEGHSFRDCKVVAMRRVRAWKGTDMDTYLRPATVFGAEKFSQYIGEVPPEEPLGN